MPDQIAAKELPDQPDGIADDSRDLPNPAAAAERVGAYITATGDGLYDIQDGAPLYARDLEALTRVPTKLADIQEELSLTTHERDLAYRELRLTQRDTHRDIAHQLDTLASPGMLQMWADTCNPRPTTPEDVLRAVAEKLRRDVTAPAPVPSRRAQEPDADATLDGALHSIWLHGKWRWLTSNMTTAEREAVADAVERYSAAIDPDGPPVAVDRWWRDEASEPAAPPFSTTGGIVRPVDLVDRTTPPARAFLGEPPCGKPGCPCGS